MSLPATFLGRVLDESGNPVGTCWVAAGDVVVTARHVVEVATGAPATVWRPEAASVPPPGSSVRIEALRPGLTTEPVGAQVVAVDEMADVAVLRAPKGVWRCAPPVVVAADSVRRGESVAVCGHSVLEDTSAAATDQDDARSPSGRALRSMDATGAWRGQAVFGTTARLGVADVKGLLEGMSGAPVVRLSDDAVVGVVSGRYNSSDGWARDSVWVVRTEDVATAWERAEVLAPLPLRHRVPLTEPASVRLAVEGGRVRLTCPQLGIEESNPVSGVPHGLRSALADLRRARSRAGTMRHDGAEWRQYLASAEEALVDLGRRLGEAFLPGSVGAALDRVLAEAERTSMPVHLEVDTHAAQGLAVLPWEALVVPPRTAPVALHHLVTMLRSAPDAAQARVVPGPVTIVVAIAAPVHGGGAVLDYESELRNVLAAVKGARAGQARVRIVPFATTAAIRRALDAGDVHVLHVSGHGAAGVLVLEDEDAQGRPVTAGEFLREAIPAGKMPPLICLAACETNVPGTTSEGDTAEPVIAFAAGLLAGGAPVVVGTETSVTDRYATRVFAQLYDELAHAADPDPVVALSRARRTVQAAFASSANPRDSQVAELGEWAVVTVQAADAGRPLFDGSATRAGGGFGDPGATATHVGGLLALDAGLFVGRRREQHELPRLLRDRSAPPGLALVGIGGIGKTTLAAEVLRRALEAEPHLLVITLSGPVTTDAVFRGISARLRQAAIAEGFLDRVLDLLTALERSDLEWPDRLRILRVNVLGNRPLILVLDNFEDNLGPAEAPGARRQFVDASLGELLARWLGDPGASRVLITCRYRFELPGDGDRFTWRDVGPLTLAETMKLAWALPRLNALSEVELHRIWAGVGGHPRTLEVVDALLAGGPAACRTSASGCSAASRGYCRPAPPVTGGCLRNATWMRRSPTPSPSQPTTSCFPSCWARCLPTQNDSWPGCRYTASRSTSTPCSSRSATMTPQPQPQPVPSRTRVQRRCPPRRRVHRCPSRICFANSWSQPS